MLATIHTYLNSFNCSTVLANFSNLCVDTGHSLFGIPTLSMTVDAATEWLLGLVIDLVEGYLPGTVSSLPQLYLHLHGGLYKCSFLPRRAGLIQLRLLAGLDGSSTRLLFRVDNLNLIGFANQTDHWFTLEDGKDLMPGATVLPFGANYSQLLGEGSLAENLAKLALGRAPALEAVRTLGMTSYPSSDPSGSLLPLQLAVATFVVTVPESLRIIPVRAKVGQLWEAGTVGYLLEDDDKYADYIQNWGTMSRLLLCSNQGRPLGSKRARQLSQIGITTPMQALMVVGIIAWPADFDMVNLEASCNDPP